MKDRQGDYQNSAQEASDTTCAIRVNSGPSDFLEVGNTAPTMKDIRRKRVDEMKTNETYETHTVMRWLGAQTGKSDESAPKQQKNDMARVSTLVFDAAGETVMARVNALEPDAAGESPRRTSETEAEPQSHQSTRQSTRATNH